MLTMALGIGVTHFNFFSPPARIVCVWIAFRDKQRRKAHETTEHKSQSSMWGDFPVYANIDYNNTYKLRLPPHLKWVHWQKRRRPVSVVFFWGCAKVSSRHYTTDRFRVVAPTTTISCVLLFKHETRGNSAVSWTWIQASHDRYLISDATQQLSGLIVHISLSV